MLLGSRAGRALTIVVLVVLVVLCGMHIAGSHHPSHRDGDAVAEVLGFLALTLVVSLLWRADSEVRPLTGSGFPRSLLGLVRAQRRPRSPRLTAPLRC